jgi:HK97 family phage major capsid protein
MSAAKGLMFNEVERRLPFIEVPASLEGMITRDDLIGLLPEVINRQIQVYAEPRRIGRELVDVIRINSDVESFLMEYGFEATEITELGEIPTAKPRYEKSTLHTKKVGVGLQFSNDMLEDQRWDLIRRATRQATMAMTRYEDNHIISTLYSGVPDGSTIIGEKYTNHQVAASADLWEDFVRAFEIGQIEGYPFNAMVMHPFQHAQLLRMDQFRDGGGLWQVFPQRVENQMATGNLGTILGMKIYVSNYAHIGKILFLNTDNYAIFGERRPLRTEQDKDILHQSHLVVMTQRYGTAVVNPSGSAMITGLKTDLAGT